MELKWLRGNPHDYGIKSGSNVYIIAKRFNEIHFLHTRYYYFDEAPSRKTQEDRNMFSYTGFGTALDNFKISEVLCFLPLPEKDVFISDALQYFPELENTIKPNQKETSEEPYDYRFDLDYDP